MLNYKGSRLSKCQLSVGNLLILWLLAPFCPQTHMTSHDVERGQNLDASEAAVETPCIF